MPSYSLFELKTFYEGGLTVLNEDEGPHSHHFLCLLVVKKIANN